MPGTGAEDVQPLEFVRTTARELGFSTLGVACAEALEPGRRMGVEVLQALGFESGYTHMEWYRKADGEAVFGEIAARPPGAR